MADLALHTAGKSLFANEFYYWLVACQLCGDIDEHDLNILMASVQHALNTGAAGEKGDQAQLVTGQMQDEFVSSVASAILKNWLTEDEARTVIAAWDAAVVVKE